MARFAAQILLINVNGIHIDNFLIENPRWTLHNFSKRPLFKWWGCINSSFQQVDSNP